MKKFFRFWLLTFLMLIVAIASTVVSAFIMLCAAPVYVIGGHFCGAFMVGSAKEVLIAAHEFMEWCERVHYEKEAKK